MVTANELKTFYNSTFFDEYGKPRQAHLVLSLKAGDKEILIPGVKVHPDDTVDHIIKAFYQYLLKHEDVQPTGADQPADDQPVAQASNPDRVVKEVIYKDNSYLVEWNPDDTYIVRRSDNGVLLGDKSPTTKSIIKEFQELVKK